MNTTISRRIEWDMGHRIPDHDSLCKHLHGHRYAVEVTIEGPIIDEPGNPERGMVRDFGVIERILHVIIQELDHSFMVFKDDPLAAFLTHFGKHCMEEKLRLVEVPFIPTAENIAAWIFERASKPPYRNLSIVEVNLWETPNCKATVTR